MRNDSIERTINDSVLSISEYMLEIIELNQKQRNEQMKRIMDEGVKGSQKDSSWRWERSETEYELYYRSMKDLKPELFDLQGGCVGTYPISNKKHFFLILHKKEGFYGVYKQEFKEAHQVTQVYQSKEEVLRNIFGTSEFEKFRGETFFLLKNGRTFSLLDNQHFRLNLVKPFKPLSFYETIEQARSNTVKDELKKDHNLRIDMLRQTLDKFHIPSDLLGKAITLNSISEDETGVRISFKENERKQELWLPDLDEQWLKRIQDNPGLQVVFDELIMDSRSIGEGFLAFYGIQIKKEFQTRLHPFEVISNAEGSYIGKLCSTGELKRLSPYFTETEAKMQLENLNDHLLSKTKNKKYVDVEKEPGIGFVDTSDE